MPTQTAMDKMILELLEEIDHDIAKNYQTETAEEPEFVEANMAALRTIIGKHLF